MYSLPSCSPAIVCTVTRPALINLSMLASKVTREPMCALRISLGREIRTVLVGTIAPRVIV
ncbi:MAG TPA: hypothetical protein VF735_04740 [Pyrinomonadaceae bacterium]